MPKLEHPSSAAASAVNRRRSPRVDFRYTLVALLLKTGETIEIRINTRERSLEGMSFTSLKPLAKNELLVYAWPNGETQHIFLARVRHVRVLDCRLFSIGAEVVASALAPEGSEAIPLHWLGYRFGVTGLMRDPKIIP